MSSIVIQALEFILALLNLILTIVIIRQFKTREGRELSDQEDEIMNEFLKQKQDAKLKRFQIRMLSRGLFIYTTLFGILSIIGDLFVFDGKGFE